MFVREGRDAFLTAEDRDSAGRFGMALFLASLAMLFGASVLGYVVVRVQLTTRGDWPADLPPLPRSMAISTIFLLVCSTTVHLAVRAAGREEQRRAARWMEATLLSGGLFLLMQGLCWWAWFDRVGDMWATSSEHQFALTGYYVLTGIHALHVVGGLLSAGWIAWHLRRSYCERAGVAMCAAYWHFLDGVWLALWAVLLITGT